MATLLDIRTNVLDNLARAITDSARDSSNADRWINQVIRFTLCTRHSWDAMEATYAIDTVANQELYAYPTAQTKDIRQLAIRLSPTSPYYPLPEESEDQLDWNLPHTTIGGTPTSWSRAGSSVRLRPIPSSSDFGLRVRVWDYPMPLVNDSDMNYFTVDQEDLVEQFATGLGWLFLGSNDTYQLVWAAAMQELDRRIEDDARRLRPKRKTISPSTRAGRPGTIAGSRLGEAGVYRQYP